MTLRPSHLTGTNGFTRFPVEANTVPSTPPSQNWWRRQCHKKKSTSDLPAIYLESDGLLPPLEMPFCHRWVSNWVWVCLIFQCFDTYGLHVGGVWHYSSFKYRILDCVTGSNFIMAHGKTAGDKSRDRAPIIHHFSESQTRLRRLSSPQSWKDWSSSEIEGGMFWKRRYECASSIASRYCQFRVLWRNLTTAKSTFRHREPQAIIRGSTPLRVQYQLSVFYYCESVFVISAHIYHNIFSKYIKAIHF